MTAPETQSAIAELSGVKKSAVLCVALGPSDAGKLLQQLSPDEVEAVSREIAALDRIPPEVIDGVLSECQSASTEGSSAKYGGLGFAKQLLEQTVGAVQAERTIEKIKQSPDTSAVSRLQRATPETLVELLQGEHSQTIALVLSQIDPSDAAKVVQSFDPAMAADVLYRIARMEKISPEVLAIVEAELAEKSDVSLGSRMTASGGPAVAASVLNATGGELEKQLLEALGSRSAETAEEIRDLMFVFEDLLLLDGKSVQRMLRDVDTKELALALKAASDELKAHITTNMSSRAAEALEEEIEYMGPVRVKDVEDAHKRIIGQVRSLEEEGEIIISGRGGSDDDVIE